MGDNEQKGKFDAVAYRNNYIAKNYDRVYLLVRKGRKAALQELAKAQGVSLNDYINTAIDERVERDAAQE